MKPVSFELGGKSANIVFADADLDRAVPGSVEGVFHNTGQVCLAGSRILVERASRRFVDRFVAATEALKVGDPLDEATEIGPLVERVHHDKVARLRRNRPRGGRAPAPAVRPRTIRAGSRQLPPPRGLSRRDNAMRVCREEIFGPVAVVIPFDGEEEAVAIANDSPYGLAGMVWTTNLDRAHRVAARVETGTIWVNCFFERELRAPFGGVG